MIDKILQSRVVVFLKEVKKELKKVSWPQRNEVVNSTIVVLVATGIITVFLYVVDLVLIRLVGLIMK